MDSPRISRVRHETRRRALTVIRRVDLSPGLVRLTLSGDDLPGFISLGFDDHIKLFFDTTDGPAARDYTPRRYDAAINELDIEFALHDVSGPATAWGRSAAVGDVLNMGGPRGSFIIEDSFDWYVLIGDEAALPAIGRRLHELRAGVPVRVIVAVENPDREIALTSRADLNVSWVLHDSDPVAIVRAEGLPAGEGYVWIAGETSFAKALRQIFVDELGHSPDHIRAAAYWRRGETGVHQVLDDKPETA